MSQTPTITLFHNPRCSKSRAALALLREAGIEPVIVEYLNQPPDRETLCAVLARLGMTARELLRSGESACAEQGLAAPGVDDARILDAMLAHPILIERPIAMTSERAVVGRPPERVLDLLQP